MKQLIYISFTIVLLFITASCREDELVVPTEYDIIPGGPMPDASPIGMYLLNEGNMGSNKASIDYVDFRNGLYARNLYAERNPTVNRLPGFHGWCRSRS